jgi:hypothetical protein
MTTSDLKRWIPASIIVGVSYFVVGFAFAAFARWSTFGLTALTWNRLAFLASAVAFAAHICYEHFRLQSPARLTAWHAALAVALGAFGLALAANIHDLGSPAGYRSRMLVALLAWPLITGVPAFFCGVDCGQRANHCAKARVRSPCRPPMLRNTSSGNWVAKAVCQTRLVSSFRSDG